MSAGRPRHEIELEVMGALHRELQRLTSTERERAINWVQERLAHEEILATGLREQALRTREDRA